MFVAVFSPSNLQSYLCGMAQRITYKPQGILLSSAVNEIAVAVDGDLDVTLRCVILSECYYSYSVM